MPKKADTVAVRITLEMFVARGAEAEAYEVARQAINQVCDDALPLIDTWKKVKAYRIVPTIYDTEPPERPEFPFGEFPNYYEVRHNMTEEAVENYRRDDDDLPDDED